MPRSGSRRARGRVALAASAAVAAVGGVFARSRPETVASWLERLAARVRRAPRARKPVRVYMDGCFDLAHFGHANALRQAKACGDVLVVGIVSDAEIARCKGPPVLLEAERRAVVASNRFVDEIIDGVPYDVTEAFMQTLYDEHDIDYIVHGDDPCLLPDGTDAYDAPKRAGKFKTIERTEGVSTTDIVDRILLAAASDRDAPNPTPDRRPSRRRQHFCATARRVAGFIGGVPRAVPRDAASTVVYVRGAFDVFHAGHADLLRRARAMGDFVLVGVVNDDAVRARRGANRPVLNAQERALSVMACRHADEVIIAAPEAVTEDLIATFRVAVVLDADGCEGEEGGGEGGEGGGGATRGAGSSGAGRADVAPSAAHEDGVTGAGSAPAEDSDPFAAAKALGIFRASARDAESDPSAGLTTRAIIERVAANRAAYEARNRTKTAKEATYYERKAKAGGELS